MRERSSRLSRSLRILTLFVLFLTHNVGRAQDGDIIPLSRKVGATLDAEEKEILGLFPDIKGFQSAQFSKLGENRYMARIAYLDRTRLRVIKRYFNWRGFQRMKLIADGHPEITDKMREEHRYKLTYLRVHDSLMRIPSSTYCTIRHSSGRRVTGTFVEYRDRTIYFQSPTKIIQFPVTEIESISYRPTIEKGSLVKKVASFAAGGVIGLALGELWNLQSRPAIDIVWHNRFTGIALGLISGSEFYEAVTILTSPKEFIAFSPGEVAKLRVNP